MNKKIYTMVVTVDERDRMEKTLNTYRIGLNEWDKTKVLEIQGNSFINYTIICDEKTFTAIVHAMSGTRIY